MEERSGRLVSDVSDGWGRERNCNIEDAWVLEGSVWRLCSLPIFQSISLPNSFLYPHPPHLRIIFLVLTFQVDLRPEPWVEWVTTNNGEGESGTNGDCCGAVDWAKEGRSVRIREGWLKER